MSANVFTESSRAVKQRAISVDSHYTKLYLKALLTDDNVTESLVSREPPDTDIVLQAEPQPFQIKYGTGVVSGIASRDTFTVGSPSIIVREQGFGTVFSTSPEFHGASCDGLFVSTLLQTLLGFLKSR
jgi:hypothetical protein